MKHPYTPVVLTPQQAPRQGFGVHEVADTLTPLLNGHGTSVEQAPVCGSQHTCVTTRHGGICEHVRPSEKTSGAGQCVTSGWMLHSPVAGSQHAPCEPGGHGFGVHAVAVTCTVPAGQDVPVTLEHAPVIGSQHTTVCGGHVMPTHVEPIP
jgi:hypothetical protein